MATRTAPAVNGTPNVVYVTLHVIDASGDLTSVAIKTDTLPTDANIEAWATAYQDATQASVYKVSIGVNYEGDADPQNADTFQRNSVKDGINLLYKDVANLRATTPRLVAPQPALLQGNQDIPLISTAPFPALLTAQAVLLPSFSLASAQYTERRERSNNPRIKI